MSEMTSTQILRTKLYPPPISGDLILRTEIIRQLEKNLYKSLTLVSAGAGYGKSITVSQWLENTECLHTWLTPDEENNDLRIFLSYLAAAVEKVAPGTLTENRSFLQAAELPPLRARLISVNR
jgi:LuxR family maltose regulon positive regulatory protein